MLPKQFPGTFGWQCVADTIYNFLERSDGNARDTGSESDIDMERRDRKLTLLSDALREEKHARSTPMRMRLH